MAMVAAIVVAIIVILAGILVYRYYFRPKSSTSPVELGGFTAGQIVTFVYTGNFTCTPSITTLFPGDSNAGPAEAKTPCEVGNASQTAVAGQVPQWVLVPAFAGLTIFGPSLGGTARGFANVSGTALLTDCGAGGSATGCADHPTYLYSPFFTLVEQRLHITSGTGGLPEGVLPTPAHDHLLNTSTTYPNVPWGSIVVLVFDPNIWPDRSSGACTASVASNLSNPTGNCLTSLTALGRALSTSSSAVRPANGGNPIWQTLGNVTLQVVVPGDVTIAEINNLDSNLYIPFSVQPGAPPSFPT